jgi:hypothetical protein
MLRLRGSLPSVSFMLIAGTLAGVGTGAGLGLWYLLHGPINDRQWSLAYLVHAGLIVWVLMAAGTVGGLFLGALLGEAFDVLASFRRKSP